MVFLDLVAHLVRKIAGVLSDDELKMLDKSNFKFIMYASFPSEEEVIGLKLC